MLGIGIYIVLQADVGLRSHPKASPAWIASVVDRRTAPMKPQGEPFADLYIAALRIYLYDHEALPPSVTIPTAVGAPQ